MNFKKYFKSAFVLALSAITLSSCVQEDEWSTPPINCTNKFDAPTMTMAEFKAQAPSNGYILIENDQIFDGYVVSSDENGNFYKTISFQDSPENPTAGLQMEVDKASNYADFPVGTHIRINAKGLRLGTDRGVVKIGSVDPTYAIGRIPSTLVPRYLSGVCDGNVLDVTKIVPKQLANLNEAKKVENINFLVTVPNVKFADNEIGKTYIDYVAGAGIDTDRNIEDFTGGTTVLRNSGFSSFGSQIIPNKSGDLTFVVSRYNNNWQMIIRNLNDVNFTENLPDVLFSDNFSGTLTGKWDPVSVTGAQVWEIRNFGNPAPGAYMNGFAGGAQNNEDWLISKPFDLTGYTDVNLSFDTDMNFSGPALQVYVTDNYTGNPTTTTWTLLPATFDTVLSWNTWTNSGLVSLNQVANKNNVRIAFKYMSSPSAGASTWELDNVNVKGTK